MNKAQKKKKRQEIRRLQEQRRLEKAKALEEQIDEEDALEDDVLDEGVDEVPDEEMKKDFGDEHAYMPEPQPGPTSFEELDAMRLAKEQAEATQEVIWDAEGLVRNILTSQLLDPDEKVTAMTDVAEEFASRVSVAKEDIEKDLELLQLEVMVAQDKRTTPFAEYYLDISKAVLSSARRNALSDSEFAMVTTRDGKKIRKYPIHDKAHVRNALSRAAQMIKRGGQGAADARAAMSKIRSAAKRMGIGSDMKKDRNAIIIEKGMDEKWRWIGWGSNNFLDRDGEIISEKAHQEYVEWWEKNKDLSPVFDTWHIPGTARKNPVDTIFYEKGFLIMSGVLTEEEAAGLLRVQKETDLGMSIGAIGGRDPNDPKVITKYRAYAITDLPLDNAANPFTGFETIVKEVGMDKKAYLTKIFGDEAKAEAFLENTDLKQKQLQDAGIASKEEKPPVEQPEKVEKIETGKEQAQVQATPTPAIDEVVKQVMKEMDIPGLNAFVTDAKEAMEKVPILESIIKELQATKDEDLAKALTPPVASKFAWTQENRVTENKDNIVKEGDKILEKVPGVPDDYWLSNATKTTPIKETVQ